MCVFTDKEDEDVNKTVADKDEVELRQNVFISVESWRREAQSRQRF